MSTQATEQADSRGLHNLPEAAEFVRQFESEWAKFHVKVHRWAAREDAVFIEFTLIGTFGEREVSWPAVDRIVLRNGLVAERVSYFDPMVLGVQLLTRPRGWRRLLASGVRPSIPRPRPHVR